VNVLRALAGAAAILMTTGACAGTPWQGTELDPATAVFAEELDVDLSGMEQTEPGLYVLDLSPGIGAAAGRTSRVWIHYAVWLPDGTLVDSSVGGEPFHARLGGSEVIRGWNLAIPGMKVGGRRKLVVRPGLAYGSRGTARVPPNATLVFEVQLLDVR
jgi:FKBP-type peptidyl-prolyl cis-trans isomerase FkpA